MLAANNAAAGCNISKRMAGKRSSWRKRTFANLRDTKLSELMTIVGERAGSFPWEHADHHESAHVDRK